MADAATFLDEQRPFRRGEIALARRAVDDPMFMLPRDLDCLRYAIRLAQISSIGPEPDALIERIGSFRLRLLQLLAPVLPTEPDQIDASDLHALLPKVVRLVDEARELVSRIEGPHISASLVVLHLGFGDVPAATAMLGAWYTMKLLEVTQ